MRYLIPILWLSLVSMAWAQETRFELDVMSKSDAHQEEFEQASDLLLAGDMPGAIGKFLDVTTKDPAPATAFIVGRLIQGFDADAAYRLEKKAYDAEPRERAALLGWGMARHRRREFAEAAALYAQYVKLAPRDQRVNALLADCLLRTGKPAEACAAWAAAGRDRSATAVDRAIWEIYGEESALVRRAGLLGRLKKGDLTAAEPLIDIDVNMEQDWWNSHVSKAALKSDLPLVGQLLGKTSKRYQAMQWWVKLRSEDEPPAEFVKTGLETTGLILNGGGLPESSLLARRLLGMAIDYHLARRADLAQRFARELTDRARSKAGDAEAMHAMCDLVAPQPDRQAALAREGWQRYHDPRFAQDVLDVLEQTGKLTPDNPELKAAMKEFPDDAAIMAAAVRVNGPDHASVELLTAAIAAQYHHLVSGDESAPDSDTLDGYFKLLKARVAPAPAPAPTTQPTASPATRPATAPATQK